MKRILSHTICECKYHIVMTISGYWYFTRPDVSRPDILAGWRSDGPGVRPLEKEAGHVCVSNLKLYVNMTL